MTTPVLTSRLRCPVCGHEEWLDMPSEACLFFHECAGCHTLLRPKAGDCCVFCSYGSVPCPPIQAGSAGGDAGCCGAARPPLASATGPRTLRADP